MNRIYFLSLVGLSSKNILGTFFVLVEYIKLRSRCGYFFSLQHSIIVEVLHHFTAHFLHQSDHCLLQLFLLFVELSIHVATKKIKE